MANDGDRHVKDLSIINERGLYVRTAVRFLKTVEQFGVEITVSKDEYTVPARSIMGLLLSVAGRGSAITVNAIVALVAARFDEVK
jgi:phosphocarrier protein HPr